MKKLVLVLVLLAIASTVADAQFLQHRRKAFRGEASLSGKLTLVGASDALTLVGASDALILSPGSNKLTLVDASAKLSLVDASAQLYLP